MNETQTKDQTKSKQTGDKTRCSLNLISQTAQWDTVQSVCWLVRHHVNMTWRLATLDTWKMMFRFMTFLSKVENNGPINLSDPAMMKKQWYIYFQCLSIYFCVLVSISSVQPCLWDSQPEAQNRDQSSINSLKYRKQHFKLKINSIKYIRQHSVGRLLPFCRPTGLTNQNLGFYFFRNYYVFVWI